MPSPQALVRVREKNQITLPRDIVQALGVENTGYISYAVSPGEVTLRAIKTSPADKRAKIQRLGQSVKSVYKNAQEADDFINNLREEWKK